MFTQLVHARVTTAATAATAYTGDGWEGITTTEFMCESMHIDSNNKLRPDGADPFPVINTWKGPIDLNTILLLGRLPQGDWVVVSVACDED